jgi:hypothetical protein
VDGRVKCVLFVVIVAVRSQMTLEPAVHFPWLAWGVLPSASEAANQRQSTGEEWRGGGKRRCRRVRRDGNAVLGEISNYTILNVQAATGVELDTAGERVSGPNPFEHQPMILILSPVLALMVIAALPLTGEIAAQPWPSMLTGPVMVSEP